jgi:hypothetical protein
MIRTTRFQDIKDMAIIGSKLVDQTMPFFRSSTLRIEDLLKAYISAPNAKVLTSVDDKGVIKGGALVVNQPNLWAEKHNSQIIGLYSTVKGDSAEMLKMILEWFTERKNSLIICYAAPIKSGLDDLLLKNNFELQGTMLVRRKYHGVS